MSVADNAPALAAVLEELQVDLRCFQVPRLVLSVLIPTNHY